MRIVFVRHGHPNYELDCLTEVGHLHAEAAAKRLAEEPFTAIHSSTCGRAVETAEHIAALHDLPVISHDFMRELSWGPVGDEPIPFNGHPWSIAYHMASQNETMLVDDWTKLEIFRGSKAIANVQLVNEGIDRWLAELGYERDGLYYRVRKANADTIAMVSHGGSSSAAIAHLFNLSFPFFCGTVHPDFTAITIVSFEGEEGALITPRIEIMNDCRHIAGIDTPPKKTHK